MQEQQTTPLVNWTHHNLTLNITNQMIQADLANDKEKFFKATIWFLRLVISYMSNEERKFLEDDLILLEKKIEEANEYNSDETKKNIVRELKYSWANEHAPLGFTVFSRSGIVYPSDDGEIDFDKLALTKVQEIIQAPFDSGLNKAINTALK